MKKTVITHKPAKNKKAKLATATEIFRLQHLPPLCGTRITVRDFPNITHLHSTAPLSIQKSKIYNIWLPGQDSNLQPIG